MACLNTNRNGKWVVGMRNGKRGKGNCDFLFGPRSSVVARTACKVHVPPLSRCSQFWHPWYEISAKHGRIAHPPVVESLRFLLSPLITEHGGFGHVYGESSVDSAGTIDLPLSEKAATPPTRLNQPI